jgi:hypothetical protein
MVMQFRDIPCLACWRNSTQSLRSLVSSRERVICWFLCRRIRIRSRTRVRKCRESGMTYPAWLRRPTVDLSLPKNVFLGRMIAWRPADQASNLLKGRRIVRLRVLSAPPRTIWISA